MTIWREYVYRRGTEAEDLWEQMYRGRTTPVRLLYVGGRGFDARAAMVMDKFVECILASGCDISEARLLLVGFDGYEIADDLVEFTEKNAARICDSFKRIGDVRVVTIGTVEREEEDLSASNALREGVLDVLRELDGHTDVVLDVSSLPRIAYLSILLGFLERLVPPQSSDLAAGQGLGCDVTLQVIGGEDVVLDAKIRSEDPGNKLVIIPGYSEPLQSEGMKDLTLVWFPVLGENRVAQMRRVMEDAVPPFAEICPVLPHPSRDFRRGENLLIEYRVPLFDTRRTPLSNVLYVHEENPFESYRQLLRAMERYQESLSVLGGCRLVVTPLSSKLITIGVALACFEMRWRGYNVAIPYAEPKRYIIDISALLMSKPVMTVAVLTGQPYR